MSAEVVEELPIDDGSLSREVVASNFECFFVTCCDRPCLYALLDGLADSQQDESDGATSHSSVLARNSDAFMDRVLSVARDQRFHDIAEHRLENLQHSLCLAYFRNSAFFRRVIASLTENESFRQRVLQYPRYFFALLGCIRRVNVLLAESLLPADDRRLAYWRLYGELSMHSLFNPNLQVDVYRISWEQCLRLNCVFLVQQVLKHGQRGPETVRDEQSHSDAAKLIQRHYDMIDRAKHNDFSFLGSLLSSSSSAVPLSLPLPPAPRTKASIGESSSSASLVSQRSVSSMASLHSDDTATTGGLGAVSIGMAGPDEFFVNATNGSGESILYHAATLGRLEIVKLLVEEFRASPKTAEFYLSEGLTLDVYRFLTERGRPILEMSHANREIHDYIKRQWQFLRAKTIGRLQQASLELGEAVFLNVRDNYGDSILHRAIYSNRVEMVVHLMELGVDINGVNGDGLTPLLLATQRVFSERVIDELLHRGADINAVNDKGNTSLMVAIEQNQSEVIRRLMDRGAKFDVQNKSGCSALMLAILCSQGDLALAMLEKGAPLNLQNGDGSTALMLAIECDLPGVTQRLLERDSDDLMLDLQNQYGNTALMVAIKHHELTTALRLIEKGASVTIENDNNDSALDLATRMKLTEVIATIESCPT